MRQQFAEFLRFGFSGVMGFCVDAGLMHAIMRSTGISPLVARGISFPLALSVTWWLNRNWTFETGRHHEARSQYPRYVAVQLAGFAINYSCFAFLVTYTPLTARPIAALALASALAMLVTYVSSRAFVFASDRTTKS
jgi:putative flippase GtrA